MNKYTYDFEIQTMTTMLINCFSDIVVKRYNVHKERRDQVKTRVVYAPKQKVLADLLDKDQNLQLPVISVHIAGLSKDEGRVFNKLVGSFYTPKNSTASINEKGPLPIDINYTVSIMTRYQEDMDQILSHLIAYVNPYFVISWRTPSRPDHEIRSSVYWNGTANLQYPTDLNANQIARVVADLSFTFKGWIFRNTEQVENIFTFNAAFIDYNINDGYLSREYLLDRSHVFEYQGAPPQPAVIEPWGINAGNIQEFGVWGRGFKDVTNVYLSGAPLNDISIIQDPFALNNRLSSDNPPFFAVKLLSSSWHCNNIDSLTFIMPSASNAGFVDVIIENPGGYGKLTTNVRVNEFNPYSLTDEQYALYVPYQVPYLSGIEVFPPSLVEPHLYQYGLFWADVTPLSTNVVLYVGKNTNVPAANLSALLVDGDFEIYTNETGNIISYEHVHPNILLLDTSYYYNGILENRNTVLFYNRNDVIPISGLSGISTINSSEEVYVWFVDLSGIINWERLAVGKYWYSSSDTDWFSLTSWYVDSQMLTSALTLPYPSTRVIILTGGTVPYVNLDDERWVQPFDIDATNIGITFYSASAANVTCNLFGSPITFTNNSEFGP